MHRMNKVGLRRLGMVMAACTLGLGGCVSQQAYDDLHEQNRVLTSLNQELRQDVKTAEATAEARGQRIQELESTVGSLGSQVASARNQNSALSNRLNDLGNQINEFQFGPLDEATNRALATLASQHPNLVTYDPELGMLRFNSDLTFDSGSDVVKPGAKESLTALARILGAQGAGYDIHVVGHTDSQPISSRTAARHPTNTHLSCHRAISVRKELIGMGVPSQKILAAGWGEMRPLVPNSSTGNTPQNRRVEIYLRSGSSFAGAPMNSGTTSVGVDTEGAPARNFDPTK